MSMQSTSTLNINPPAKCVGCKTPTYVLGLNFKPECCKCLEKRLGVSNPEPDIEIRDGRIYWTKKGLT